jgi:hypothetical protein
MNKRERYIPFKKLYVDINDFDSIYLIINESDYRNEYFSLFGLKMKFY